MTYVIAEAGACHDGDLRKAYELIAVAAQAGANACKFQWVSDAKKLVERRRAPHYEAAYRVIQFPVAWHPKLREACGCHGLEYLCTTYLVEDIAVIAPYVSVFKIASFEAQDADFISQHRGKPLIISTGMLSRRPMRPLNARWLQCTSAYPAPLDEMHLATIRYHGFHGLSDHSGMTWMGGLAVAAGAEILETHIKLDTTDVQNLDAGPHALLPHDYATYVAEVRRAERAMGVPVKSIQASEAAMLPYVSAP